MYYFDAVLVTYKTRVIFCVDGGSTQQHIEIFFSPQNSVIENIYYFSYINTSLRFEAPNSRPFIFSRRQDFIVYPNDEVNFEYYCLAHKYVGTSIE